MRVVLEAFPGSLLSAFPYLPQLSVCFAPSPLRAPDFPGAQVSRLPQLFQQLVA